MKISIWQQFASNHSAAFTVVGQFQDLDSATKAAKVVRDAVKSISDWYALHPDIKQLVINGQQKAPTEAELEISRKFGVPTYRALDWLATYTDTPDTLEIVREYGNLIFVTTETWRSLTGWAGATLFDDLVKKLTQNVFISQEDSFQLLVSLTCVAPDEQRAILIGHICRRFTRPPARHHSSECPWIVFYLRHQPDNEAQVQEAIWNLTAEIDENDHGKIIVEGRHITLNGLDFRSISTGLPALIKWLTEQEGCSDMNYQFEQIKLDVW